MTDDEYWKLQDAMNASNSEPMRAEHPDDPYRIQKLTVERDRCMALLREGLHTIRRRRLAGFANWCDDARDILAAIEGDDD